MAENIQIKKFCQITNEFDIILIDRKDDLMKQLSKNNKVIVLKKKAHRPNSDGNNDTQAPAWFKEFKKENDQCWEKQYQFNTQVLEFMKKQLEFNARQEQFNQFVIEQFKQHGWVK